MPLQSRVEAALAGASIPYRPLNRAEASTVRHHWLKTFAARVLKQKGCEIFNGYRWHGFSFRIEDAIEGEAALREYQIQLRAPFVVFDEDEEFYFRCEAASYPDFTTVSNDVYVAHYDMRWTMAFTHEQPAIGPFFARGG